MSTEIWHKVFDLLPIRDIFRVSRTTCLMRGLTQGYWSWKLNVARVLQPFFCSIEQIHLFLQMMHRTGSIVSGSTALQLFERTYYEESDLDFYVNVENVGEVYGWLTEAGFQRVEQDEAKQRMVIGDSYPVIDEIEKVEGYVKVSSPKILQVITTKNSPVLAVLKFHSSKLLLVHYIHTYRIL